MVVELLTHVCDGITGQRVDTVPSSAFSYERLLSAQGSGSASVPLDGSFGKVTLRGLLEPWRYMLAHERDGQIEYAGYITGRGYKRGSSVFMPRLGDLWRMWGRRVAVDHYAPNVEAWEETVTGNLAMHARQMMLWGTYSPIPVPASGLPFIVPEVPGGVSVTRTYYGYHVPSVADALNDLMAEGLDIYFRPHWSSPGVVAWHVHQGVAWSSGVVRELSVTAPDSPAIAFSEDEDGARVTTNSVWLGEGSEVDMLTRSNLSVTSPLPLLERVDSAKTVSNPDQLNAMSQQTLVTFGAPTNQWDLVVAADFDVDVGDTVRAHFDGDPGMPDGWYSRRVVKVSGDSPEQKTIGLQPTGGA